MGAGAAMVALSYEELRQRKLEENKKKLEELKLGHLCVALREAVSPKTSSPAKKIKKKAPPEEGSAVLRRSVRVANLPEPKYSEMMTSDVLEGPKRRRFTKRRDLDNRVYASDEARSYAQTKAEELELELEPDIPLFVKPMLQSHTTGGFWLGLPNQFCNKYLPKHDATMALIDENDEEFHTTYLAHKKGLSAGWRGFSIFHELVDGDALVFQLFKPTAFKVYIIRASSYDSNT